MLTSPQPRTRKLTIIAQDPSLVVHGKILTTEVEIPAEALSRGPCGYRVHVVDYDTSTGMLYMAHKYEGTPTNPFPDPFRESAARGEVEQLLRDPQFHQQNVYAIVMRTLAHFEFALGRRVPWGFKGHQLYVAPHAFADPNAFYSEKDQCLMFGYFKGRDNQQKEMIFSCLSHDVIAHETTHALLDGLRERYTDPSSPEQAGFHEGFADVVALLSVFSLKDIVSLLLGDGDEEHESPTLIAVDKLTEVKLRASVLLGMAEQMGRGLSGVRGNRGAALRRSVNLPPLKPSDSPDKFAKMPEFKEPHRRGELLVAAMMNAFLQVWLKRIERLKAGGRRKLDRQLVVEEGAAAADHLLTMAIRAIDYAPPTDLQFCDFLSALLSADRETVPDDRKYGYRQILRSCFGNYGMHPASNTDEDGAWPLINESRLRYDRVHLQALMQEPDEAFRFLWENKEVLGLHPDARTIVESVRPCMRLGPDGFILRETIATYTQLMTLRAEELESLSINIPPEMPVDQEVTLYGGGALIFDEFGRLKFHPCNRLDDETRQTPRLRYLWEYGYFQKKESSENIFAQLHLQRASGLTAQVKEEF